MDAAGAGRLMRGISPVWIAATIAAILAGTAILYNTWAAKRANPTPVKAIYRLPEPPDKQTREGRRILGNVEVRGPSIVQRDPQGREVWSARAQGELEISDEKRCVTATAVAWQITRGQDTVTIRSSRMEFSWSGGEVSFGGDIEIRDARNRRFVAELARFQSGTDKIICDNGVTWEAGRYRVRADTLVIDLKAKRLRLRGDVRIVVGS